jgi:poly(A) polymerase/tRNA nucleotidyltransferase (CCA-adding enzyme)
MRDREKAREQETKTLLRNRFAEKAPRALTEVLSGLERLGFKAYAVGGGVRDLLLGREVKEWDVATDARPSVVLEAFPHTVPTGIEHGTVTVVVGEDKVEVTTFRRDSEYIDARHPKEVFFSTDVGEDLARRDFTVNAIAYRPVDGDVRAAEGAFKDLATGTIRTVGDPVERFREDGLRPLRAIRFACQLDFDIENRTFGSIVGVLDRVSLVSLERVRDELMKVLKCEKPSRGLDLMHQCGLLAMFLPELDGSVGVAQNEFHAYDVYWHSLCTCDAVPREKPLVRLAALLHDVGKPSMKEEHDGRVTFYNHQHVGAGMVASVMDRLRFSSVEREYVVRLVDNHMFDYHSNWTDGALRRFVRRVGIDAVADVFDLRIADYLGNGLRQGFPHYLEEMRARIDKILEEDSALTEADLAIDGNDVMRELGVGPGREVGAALRELLELVLDEPALNSREELLARLRQMRRPGLPPA